MTIISWVARARRITLPCLIIALFFLLSGCGYKNKETYSQLLHRPLDLQYAYNLIVEGKTTRAEIEEWLGTPYIDTKDSLGRVKWIYLAPEISSSRTLLEITFDKNKVVISQRIDSTGGNGGAVFGN